jgi:hypothetical protein
MTALSDIKAVAPTANAKASVQAKGADVTALMAAATLKAAELKVLVAQIIALHPSGDANLTALNSILAELA